MYGVFDQTIWQGPAPSVDSGAPPPNIGIFAQYGLADRDISAIDQHIGAGIAWTGPLQKPDRAADVMGIGASYVHFSEQAQLPKDHELAIETFYKIQLKPWFSVQPDLQYIINPGGAAGRDAVVATVRVELDF